MNIYSTEFFAQCPNNGQRIKYALRIESTMAIPVEQIVTKVESLGEGFHEDMADELQQEFGGVQTLTADHHSVLIETRRP